MDYTVGQLARQCGLSVRALHHYEAIGLLTPSGRSDAGYRRYSAADVQRLHRILAYKQLGVPLKEIEKYLGPNAPPLKDLLARQLEAAEQEAARHQRLVSLLKRLASSPDIDDEPALTAQLIELMNTMQSIARHFTPGEQQTLKDMRAQFSPATLEAARRELAELVAGFKAACANGVDVRQGDVAALARRWKALGTPALAHDALRANARDLIATSADVQKATGISPELKAYIERAIAAAGGWKTQGA